jgi:sugar/nucleoside kinase (ribokinase family)
MKNCMNVFLDTEFTDFLDPRLISLGMASEYGEDFYAEVPYPDHACSAFVKETIIPLLGKIPHSHFTFFNLRLEIIKWLEIVRRNKENVFICVDYQADWDLFCNALDYRVPSWCHYKLVTDEIVELMLFDFFKHSGLPEHHALYDAQANRHAYRVKPLT